LDNQTVKEACKGFLITTPDILVQKLPEGKTETKTSERTVVIFLQPFHPETFSLGERFEFETDNDEKLGSFRDRICDLTGITHLGLVPERWEGPKLYVVPDLDWIDTTKSKKERESSHRKGYDPNHSVSSLNLTDGDLLLYKNFDVPLKKLTEEEQKKMKIEEEKKRMNRANNTFYSWRLREENLVIKTQDVALDDEN